MPTNPDSPFDGALRFDAVDLIDHLRRQTGHKIAAEQFRQVRTVGDVVEAVHRISQADA